MTKVDLLKKIKCSECLCLKINTTEFGGRRYCERCFNAYTRVCGQCNRRVGLYSSAWTGGRGGNCYTCSIQGVDYVASEAKIWKSDKSRLTAGHGEIIKSSRPFGCEIECQGQGDAICPPEVKRHGDASIRGTNKGWGIEYVTYPMVGAKAETVINAFCEQLQKRKYGADSSCGYHVHIDVSDIGPSDVEKAKKLFLFYMAFEDVIYRLVPSARSKSQWCKPLNKDYTYDVIRGCGSMEELERAWYQTTSDTNYYKDSPKDSSRYHGANFHTLFRARHLELRYHSGTIEAKKILEWANLHCMIADKVLTTGVSDKFLEDMRGLKASKTKLEHLCNYIGLSRDSAEYFQGRFTAYKPRLFTKSKETN